MAEVVVIDSGKTPKRNRRLWLWIPLVIVLGLAIAISGFVVWAINPTAQVDNIALAALESSDNITVTDTTWLAFLPHEPPTTGFIFYPGGRVPSEAYAPIARQIAEAGYLAVIVYPPIKLAILNTNQAIPVMEHFSAIEHWVVGGHSLGGSAASIFAENNLDNVDGLVLMASYPVGNGLRDSNLDVVSIYGTNDGLLAIEEIDNSRETLPTNTLFVAIEGGNHAQFGFYGEQGGDNVATISQEAQFAQTIEATLNLLRVVDNQ